MKSFSIEINKTAESFSFFRSKQQKGLLNKKHKDDLVWVVLTKKRPYYPTWKKTQIVWTVITVPIRILVWENRICGVGGIQSNKYGIGIENKK